MKPSDTSEARRERARRKRSRDRWERHIAAANALAADLPRETMSHVWDRAIAGDLPYSRGKSPFTAFLELLQEEIARNLDLWEMATGETCQGLCKAQQLALDAYLASASNETASAVPASRRKTKMR